MANIQLTAGAVKAMYISEQVSQPIVQVIDIKKVQSQGNQANQERYRLIISDGVHYQQAMLGTQQNNLIKDGKLENNSIVKLNEHICNSVNNRRIIIILNLDILAVNANTIGNPQNIETVMQGQPTPPVQQYQNPNNFQNNNNNFQNNNSGQNNSSFPSQTRYTPPTTTVARPTGGATTQGQPVSKGTPEDLSGRAVVPINGMQYQKRWVIKVRVTLKGPIKTYSNARTPDGKLFAFDVVDQEKGEIRVTMFNEMVDIFYPLIQEGNVYWISGGALKLARKEFSNIKNEYELTLDNSSIIQQAPDDGTIGGIEYQFTPIGDLIHRNEKDVVDVLGVVVKANDKRTIPVQRTSKEVSKRDITLIGIDGKSVDVSLWDAFADAGSDELFNSHPVLAIKGARVSNFNTRSLNTVASSHLDFNPNFEEAQHLRAWYDSNVGNLPTDSVTVNSRGGGFSGSTFSGPEPFKTFAEVKQIPLTDPGKTERFITRGTVTMIKHDKGISYKACKKCNKKVSEEVGGFRCENCGTVTSDCDERYILALTASDHTGSSWLSAFNDSALIMLNGIPASNLPSRENNPSAYDAVFEDAQFKMYKFHIRHKADSYGSELRPKCTIDRLEKINFATEGRALLTEIGKY